MASKKDCSFCDSPDMAIGHSWNIRGGVIHPWYCQRCGKVESYYASKANAEAWAQANGALLFVETATLKKLRAGAIDVNDFDHMQPCEACGARGTSERHHWAPQYLFGDQSDKWPTSLLCRGCHQRWHQLVTPNMGNRKVAA